MKFKILIGLLLYSLGASAQLNINHYIQTGQVKLSTNNYVGAIENFSIVIKFKPQLPEPYFYRATAKHQLEDYRGAISDYTKAIEIKPYYPQAYQNRGHAYLAIDKYDEAIADYTEALSMSPHNAGIYNNRGIAKISKRDIDGAIEDYNKALEITPNYINALINRSNAFIANEDTKSAIRDLNKIIIMRPHYASAYLLRGLARFELGDYGAALRDFDQTIRFDSESAYAYNNRGLVKQRLEDFQGALMDYDMALQLNPTMPNAYFNRALIKDATGQTGAEEDYRIAAQLDPRYNIPKRTIEEEYWAQLQQQSQTQSNTSTDSIAQAKIEEDASKARRRFRLSLADTRNIPTNEEEVVDGLVQNKNVIIEIQNVFKISSFVKNSINYDRMQYYSSPVEELNKYNNYTPQLTIDNQEMDDFMGSYSANAQYFSGKLKINTSSENYLSRAIFLALNKEYSKAIDDLGNCIEKDSKNELAYFTRANCRLKVIEQLESLPSLGGDPNSYFGSDLYANDYKQILKDYDKTIKLNPNFPFAYYNKAYVKCRLGEYEEGMQLFKQALEIQPDMAEAYFNLGLTKIYLDDIDGAAADLSRAGELGINSAYNIIKRYCN